MTEIAPVSPKPKRGRPPRAADDQSARKALINAGLALLTERGYAAVGLDEILRKASVPKGSFYYHFASKADFGLTLIAAYHDYMAAKLDRWLSDETLPPLKRIRAFARDAEQSMARYDFTRGCLIGNLGPEAPSLVPEFAERLKAVLTAWESRTAECLALAQKEGSIGQDQSISDLAAYFWIGWEGAVLRARLEGHGGPLRLFIEGFMKLATRTGSDR
ncbi:TetR family transcriptional regulator [Martelella alba]|uniref:TetR family transcriptional regulator n=1 Tax=Martelella alba TaxID=2590451 RepID=A0A506UJ18_9HYPH|nr:TetR/AcrR family transcriptional regulator [Martelella alba]TPW33306.1 TetR family transcriptional regulator [Martelella alba]